MTDARPIDAERLAADLAALPDRRDFAFSAEIGRAAWIDEAAVEWVDDDAPGRIGRVLFPEPLPVPTQLELVAADLIGLCRPTAAGLEVVALDLDVAAGTGSPRTVVDLATPQTVLLPLVPGADSQLLAVVGFDDITTVWRIAWRDGTMTEVGRLPAPITGGVWLDATGDRLAVNLEGDSGRSSVYVVDFGTALGGSRRPCRGDTPQPPGSFSRLFEASPDSEDRIVLADPATGRVVVTTDAFGYPAVGVAAPSVAPGVRFVPALPEGDEAGEPCLLLPDGRTLVLRHENGVESHLRLADTETLEVAGPIPLPPGEVGAPVVVTGRRLRFPFSAPDEPWRPASFDLRTGDFSFDALPPPPPGPGHELVTARVASFPSGAGPMPALVYPSAPGDGPLSGSGLAVVALHGGPIARYGADLVPEFQLFARLGLPTVALNYPGSTGSGHEYTRSLFGRAGSVDVEAVASVVDSLAAGGRRVILYGESYGAFLALSVASVRPCAGVIAFAPFASFESLSRSGSPEVRDLLNLLDEGNHLGTGRNLLTGCRTIRGKVLISHGTADMRIPAAESRALAQALRGRDGAGEHDVRFVEMDGQGHDLSGRSVLQRWYREIATFVGSLPDSRTPAQRVHQAAGALSRRPREDQPERR